MFPTSPLKKRATQKEKSQFTPQDEYTDLNPPITYRHLLSPHQGVRDPLRVIALCDSDAFYAACEQVRLGIDPSRPLVVRQWDALIAVNYPARAFGITRMSSWRDALKKCPELTVVHVATYKEGDNAPEYWDNPDTATHKVRAYPLIPPIKLYCTVLVLYCIERYTIQARCCSILPREAFVFLIVG
jgi:DNA polymerase eta